jgi:transcription antitermination factor NusA-like protein
MTQDESLKIVRRMFAHVEIVRLVVEYDPLAGGEVAKIYVRHNQLEAALGKNGSNARRAAMQSGMDVEVLLSQE